MKLFDNPKENFNNDTCVTTLLVGSRRDNSNTEKLRRARDTTITMSKKSYVITLASRHRYTTKTMGIFKRDKVTFPLSREIMSLSDQ